MNCKPGDLAVIVRVPKEGHYDECFGRVIKVTTLRTDLPYIAWHFEWNGKTEMKGKRGHRCISVPDFALRPIRPGDITDEEVRELFSDSPKQTEEA